VLQCSQHTSHISAAVSCILDLQSGWLVTILSDQPKILASCVLHTFPDPLINCYEPSRRRSQLSTSTSVSVSVLGLISDHIDNFVAGYCWLSCLVINSSYSNFVQSLRITVQDQSIGLRYVFLVEFYHRFHLSGGAGCYCDRLLSLYHPSLALYYQHRPRTTAFYCYFAEQC
jgi:hypothetical protein